MRTREATYQIRGKARVLITRALPRSDKDRECRRDKTMASIRGRHVSSAKSLKPMNSPRTFNLKDYQSRFTIGSERLRQLPRQYFDFPRFNLEPDSGLLIQTIQVIGLQSSLNGVIRWQHKGRAVRVLRDRRQWLQTGESKTRNARITTDINGENLRNQHIKQTKKRTALTGADPGFFLGGGALLSQWRPWRWGKKKFKSEYVYTKTKASSRGGGEGGCAPPAPSP